MRCSGAGSRRLDGSSSAGGSRRSRRAGDGWPGRLREPLAGEFRIVHEEQNLGLPLRDAMLNLVDRVPRDDMRFVTTAILLQKETGGNLAVILDKTAALARERARLYGQLRIYTAQGRITGWILCMAPFVMCGVLSLLNWKYERILFTNPTGLKSIYVGLVHDGLGYSYHSQDYRYQGLNQVGTMSLIIFLGILAFVGFFADHSVHAAALLGAERPAGRGDAARS